MQCNYWHFPFWNFVRYGFFLKINAFSQNTFLKNEHKIYTQQFLKLQIIRILEFCSYVMSLIHFYEIQNVLSYHVIYKHNRTNDVIIRIKKYRVGQIIQNLFFEKYFFFYLRRINTCLILGNRLFWYLNTWYMYINENAKFDGLWLIWFLGKIMYMKFLHIPVKLRTFLKGNCCHQIYSY